MGEGDLWEGCGHRCGTTSWVRQKKHGHRRLAQHRVIICKRARFCSFCTNKDCYKRWGSMLLSATLILATPLPCPPLLYDMTKAVLSCEPFMPRHITKRSIQPNMNIKPLECTVRSQRQHQGPTFCMLLLYADLHHHGRHIRIFASGWCPLPPAKYKIQLLEMQFLLKWT
jgi:hypothetical protein